MKYNFHLLKIAGSSCPGFCKQKSLTVFDISAHGCSFVSLIFLFLSSSCAFFVCGLFPSWTSGCVSSPSAPETCLGTVAVQLMSLTAHLVLRAQVHFSYPTCMHAPVYLVILPGDSQRWLDMLQRKLLSCVFLAPETSSAW